MRTKVAPRAIRTQAEAEATGTAADDPVTTAMAVLNLRLNMIPAWAILAVMMGLLFIDVLPDLLSGRPVDSMAIVLILGLNVGAVITIQAAGAMIPSRALLRNGPWARVAVRLDNWQTRKSGLANATGTVTLASGESLPVILRNANVDLLASMWETGSVWVAGEPAARRRLALGFPGYPLVGTAVFG